MFVSGAEVGQDDTNPISMSSIGDDTVSTRSESEEKSVSESRVGYDAENSRLDANLRGASALDDFDGTANTGTRDFRIDKTYEVGSLGRHFHEAYADPYRMQTLRYGEMLGQNPRHHYYEHPSASALSSVCREKSEHELGHGGIDTPMGTEGEGLHFIPEDHDPASEFDERMLSLRFLIQYAGIEVRKMVGERVCKFLEASKKVEDEKMELRRKKKEILDIESEDTPTIKSRMVRNGKEHNIVSVSNNKDEPVETLRKGRIGSFADFENSMFLHKSKNGAKAYTCPYEGCGMELPTLSRIKRHYIVHTKLKPFKCLNKNCNKRFSRKDNMLQHYKIHCNHTNNYR